MTSRRGPSAWLRGWFGRRRAHAAETLVLTDPIDERYHYGSISKHIAKFQIGQVVRHRVFAFRGIIFDVDPQFANSDEWYESIPEEVRPRKDQPFYHLFAENERTHYIAYVSEQNLVPDDSEMPLSHPDIPEWFDITGRGTYELKKHSTN
ncbi:MAG: heat shock protein HspQ [Hyphomonas sp.]|nr:heat shock protein HspQ [Hyphomonas sp.]MBA3069694.1 heat shock protein HspQ [Hyphomonas sp.]MBU4062535.1 heat shock protein HspQ [Alphaproteobacteria bacterium]MBU4163886.1 heat shock protein HspQ [Alphaproteobacteria bacterium]